RILVVLSSDGPEGAHRSPGSILHCTWPGNVGQRADAVGGRRDSAGDVVVVSPAWRDYHSARGDVYSVRTASRSADDLAAHAPRAHANGPLVGHTTVPPDVCSLDDCRLGARALFLATMEI